MRVRRLDMRSRLAPFVLACLVASAAGEGHAAPPRSYDAAAARAVFTTLEALPGQAGALLDDCTGTATAAQKRSCISGRRRRARTALRTTYLLDLPAGPHLEVLPYDAASGGFRVRVRPLRVAREGAPGVLATSPTVSGNVPASAVVAEGFVPMPAADAAAAPEGLDGRVRLHLLVRFGADFEDGLADDPGRRYGTRLAVVGFRLVDASTAAVLFDSFSDALPPPPVTLDDRVRLWSHTERRVALFVAPDGTTSQLSVDLLPRDPGQTTQTAVLMQTHGAHTIEVTRVLAPCCSSSIDVRRHGADRILAIVTEQATGTTVARGRVLLLEWHATAHLFEPRAEWVGSNDATPPAWVLDPSAPVPAPE